MEQSVIVGLITFFLGLILGHRLTLGRDKRKEFNVIVIPIRGYLMDVKHDPRPVHKTPSKMEIDRFIRELPFWRRKTFNLKWNQYIKEAGEDIGRDSYGGTSYKHPETISSHADGLLKFTKYK